MQQKLLQYVAVILLQYVLIPACCLFPFFIAQNSHTSTIPQYQPTKTFSSRDKKTDTLVIPVPPANRYDVAIDEIMADPSPAVALPEKEWLELKNISTHAINLLGWTITDGSGSSGAMPQFILQPDSLVIICASGAVAVMEPFGNTIAVTRFPSLNNSADLLTLFSAEGKIIDAVNYTADWYKDAGKQNGGWTLEMMDTRNPCTGSSNWKASSDKRGGTPGIKNATDAINPDTEGPGLLGAFAIDSVHVMVYFDKALDTANAVNPSHYIFSEGISNPVSAVVVEPLFTRAILKLATPLVARKAYSVTVSSLTDCRGNFIGTKNTARVGLAQQVDSFDIVVNEVLFNPPPMGSDYVELYNRGNKIIDLSQIYIANRNANGSIGNAVPVSKLPQLFFPQDYLVLTKDIAAVKATYLIKNPDAFIATPLPALNIDKGSVLILNSEGSIIDQLLYSEQWHFNLLTDKKGISLERIDFNAPTQLAGNWHSAATSVGYGTPGYKNSQLQTNLEPKEEISISPEIVSPDKDGVDDFLTISYHFAQPGNIANITIFDATGKPVRYLQRNALCGTSGSFDWDGLGDKNQRLTTGVYIVYSELFNLKGQTKKFKNPVVLATKN